MALAERNGRKTLTTVQGLPKKFDQKKILKVIKKKFACNGTIVNDSEMGEVIQLQGDQRKDVQEFLTDKKEGLELDAKTIKVRRCLHYTRILVEPRADYRFSRSTVSKPTPPRPTRDSDRSGLPSHGVMNYHSRELCARTQPCQLRLRGPGS